MTRTARRAGGVSPPSDPEAPLSRLRGLGGLTPPARLFVLFVLAALLAVPIFGHGCHGDDVDDEPQAAPPTAREKPAHR